MPIFIENKVIQSATALTFLVSIFCKDESKNAPFPNSFIDKIFSTMLWKLNKECELTLSYVPIDRTFSLANFLFHPGSMATPCNA